MTDTLSLMAPAKLNLMLHITGQREDGYHNLQTVFQLLDYGDNMHFSLTDNEEIALIGNFAGVAKTDNIIYKACQLLKPFANNKRGLHISVEKILPMGGGLGGGSSNAASTLLAVNQLWQCRRSVDQLAELGLQLGADVPVFVRGRSAWGEGVGEKLSPLELPETWFVVLKPEVEVATAKIFAHQELTRDTTAITVAAFLRSGGHNDCENIVRQLYPDIDQALIWLNDAAKNKAMLTGTGACIFAPCDHREAAAEIFAKRPKNLRGFIAKGVNYSPACV